MRVFCLILALMPHVGWAGSTTRNPDMTYEPKPTQTVRTLSIELLALDLNTCSRCTGTDRHLTEAIESVAGLLRETGTQINVSKHVVTTADEAERLRFTSSPTIRIDGRDIALQFKESSCRDCGDLCGCDGGVDCRVWIWQGREYLEAPKGLIVDALLKAYVAGPTPGEPQPYTMPANLRSFFAAKSAQASKSAGASDAAVCSTDAAAGTDDCCDRTTCCDTSAKSACCGEGVAGAATPVNNRQPCGCR